MKSRRTPVGDEIYEELLSRVLASDFGPNERIAIDPLCRELGISQTPIREALHRLSADGIVVRTHLAGYRVAPKISRDQFEDLVEVRLLLEPVAARQAAERIEPEGIELLDGLAADMAAPVAQSASSLAYASFSRLDTQFHDQIALAGGNSFIRDSLARLHTHVHLFRLSSHPHITELAVDEHRAVLSAIRLRDPEAAAYQMRRHIEASADRFRLSFTGSE